MQMNRRNVLIGLGTATAAGGAVFGTGAFSTVEAQRSVNVSTSNDSSALLTLNVVDSNYASTESGDNAGDDVLSIDLTNLNDDAITTFNSVFSIENNSSGNKWVYVGSNAPIDGNIVDFKVTSGVTSNNGGDSIIDSSESIEVATTDTANVDIVVDATQGDPNFNSDVTIYAEDSDPTST